MSNHLQLRKKIFFFIFVFFHNWHPLCLRKCSLKNRENFFLTLRNVKKSQNSKIFNNIGSHDGLKKNLPKSAKMQLIPVFFYSPCICIERERKRGREREI